MRRYLGLSLLVAGIAATLCGVSMVTLGTPPWAESWGRFQPDDPSDHYTVEQMERFSDSQGPLAGRVRRTPEGGFEIRYVRKGLWLSFLTLGIIALVWSRKILSRRAPAPVHAYGVR